MTKEMIINAHVPENVRVAITDGGRLVAFFEDLAQDHRDRANIYRGRIINIEPSLDACFVDYGADRHGFLPFSEIVEQVWLNKPKDKSETRIDRVVKRGQLLTVQVAKEAGGTKGARLTTDLSLAGRFMVLMPFNDTRGVSRKIEDPDARKECREFADKLAAPKGTGLIIRTVGLGQTKRALTRDLNFLVRLWKDIQAKAKQANQPGLLHAEADLVQRILRDYFSVDIERVWIDDRVALEKAEQYFKLAMPRQRKHLKPFYGKVPIFTHFGIEEQIEAIHQRQVKLPSGGSLVIDQTEALVAIDVNSGKMKGKRNQEATAYETNLEAAREIGRQLELRDLGGIIVIDFIDMTSSAHKKAVEKALRDVFKQGKARTRLSKISAFGLLTLTRQRLGKSVRALGQKECPTCGGSGAVPDPDVASVRLVRKLRALASGGQVGEISLRVPLELGNHLLNRFRQDLLAIERDLAVKLDIEGTTDLEGAASELSTRPRTDPPPVREEPAREASQPSEETATSAPDGGEHKAPKRRRRRRKKKSASSGSGAEQGPTPDAVPQAEAEKKTDQSDDAGTNGSTGRRKKPARRRRSSRGKKAKAAAGADQASAADPATTETAEPKTGKSDHDQAKPDDAAPPKKRRRRRRKKKSAD